MRTTPIAGARPRGRRLRGLLAGGLLALLAAGCAGPPGDPAGTPPTSLGDRLAALVGVAPAGPVAATGPKAAARSIWGVVPDPPRRKADLRPELIEGSAVAVAADTLLASCRVVGDRTSVGLVRHNKYRIAKVSAVDSERTICALRVAQGPLIPARGYRSLGNLRPGEPVFAFTSRTSADLALSRGVLAGTSTSGDPFLETTLLLPTGARSAVLFDEDGNLIGLGSAGPTRDSLVLAAPVTGSMAPQLASRDLGPARILLASLWRGAGDDPRQPPTLFPIDARDDDDPTFGARSAPTTEAGLGAAAEPPEPAVASDGPQPAPADRTRPGDGRRGAERADERTDTANRGGSGRKDGDDRARSDDAGDRDQDRAGRDDDRGRERADDRDRRGKGESGRDDDRGDRGRDRDDDGDRGGDDDRGRDDDGGRDGGKGRGRD
jgi:hypothetical protein